MSARPTYTPSMLASALKHYDERATWVRAVRPDTGKSFIVYQGSTNNPKTGKPWIYYTARDGSFCTCKGYSYHGDCCSHSIAVLMEVAQARRLATRRPARVERHDLVSAF